MTNLSGNEHNRGIISVDMLTNLNIEDEITGCIYRETTKIAL